VAVLSVSFVNQFYAKLLYGCCMSIVQFYFNRNTASTTLQVDQLVAMVVTEGGSVRYPVKTATS